jgi:hypothetical protein
LSSSGSVEETATPDTPSWTTKLVVEAAAESYEKVTYVPPIVDPALILGEAPTGP